jgi:DNA primase
VARVAEEELEQLKREVPLGALVAGAGVELRKAGADLVGRGPFHDDREPSLVVSPGKNLWHCLGACQAGGSVIDWVMRAQGVSFRHAVELLRSRAGARPFDGPVPARATARKLALPLDREAGDAELLAQVVSFYHQTLLEAPEALAYLASRKVGGPEAIEAFRLGYANRTLAYRLATKDSKAGTELRGRLQALGVLRASGHEHFNGSVVVPVFDGTGAVAELYGRKVRDDLRPGTPPHLYLPGPHRGVWNLAGITGVEEVVLAESLIDALSFWCAGYPNVTAAYGTEGFTDELAEGGQARRRGAHGPRPRVLPGRAPGRCRRQRRGARSREPCRSARPLPAQGGLDGQGDSPARTRRCRCHRLPSLLF